jgi:hypothetical protein
VHISLLENGCTEISGTSWGSCVVSVIAHADLYMTPSIRQTYPHMVTFCLLRRNSHFGDAQFERQMPSTMLSQHHYSVHTVTVVCLADGRCSMTIIVLKSSTDKAFILIHCVLNREIIYEMPVIYFAMRNILFICQYLLFLGIYSAKECLWTGKNSSDRKKEQLQRQFSVIFQVMGQIYTCLSICRSEGYKCHFFETSR